MQLSRVRSIGHKAPGIDKLLDAYTAGSSFSAANSTRRLCSRVSVTTWAACRAAMTRTPAMHLTCQFDKHAGDEGSYSDRGRMRSASIHSRKSREARWARRQADSCATRPMSLGNGVLSADGVVHTRRPPSS